MSRIMFPLCALSLTLCVLVVPSCLAAVTSPVVSSTEYSVTVTFGPDTAADNYTAMFILTLFPKEVTVKGPFNGSRLSLTYDGAQPGYNYTVQLYENSRDVDDIVFNGTIATVPLPPVNVTVTDRGTNFLFVDWDTDKPYSSHDISFQKSSTSQIEIVSGTADTFFNLTNLDPGFLYDISVQTVSFYAGGVTKSNSSWSISNFTLPSKPVNLTVEALNTTHVFLAWDDEQNSHQDSYQVKYFTQDASDVQEVVECVASPCTFAPGQPAGQVVTVMVYALSNNLVSEAAEVQGSTEPGMVTDFKAIPGVRSLHIMWAPPQASVVSNYGVMVTNIYDNQTKTFVVPSKGGSNVPLDFLADQLRGGSAYRVSVEARTDFAAGQGAIDVFYTVPETVSGLKAEAINTSAVSVSWSNPTHSEIENIGIEVAQIGLVLQEPSVATSQVITGLTPGQLYQVSVTVLTKTPQLKSQAMNVSVNAKPVMPRLVSSSSEERELFVTVELSENVGVYEDFRVVLQENGTPKYEDIVNSSATFQVLVPGTAYELIAYTVSGDEESEPLHVTLYTRPGPARALMVDIINGSAVQVEWEPPAEGGYDNFTVTLEESEGGSAAQVRTTSDTQIVFLTTTAGTLYNVTIVTIKGDQKSSEISDQNTTTPLNVKDIRVGVRGVTAVTLVWDPPVASGLDGYALTFAPTNLTLYELTSNLTQFRLDPLQADTDYVVQIFTFALRPDGVKLFSPARLFNFSTYPESVAALYKVEATSDSITVNWTAPVSGDFNLYQLGLREDSRNPQMFPFLVPRTKTNHTFENLKPGQMYTVAIRTVLQFPNQRPRYGISTRLTRVTKPLPVTDVSVVAINTSAVSLMWNVNQTSQQNSFLISYGPNTDTTRTLELTVTNFILEYEITVGQLLSGTEHVFEVSAMRTIDGDSEEGEPIRESGSTVPMPVSNLTIVTESRTLKLSWKPPSEGNWESYRVSYRGVLSQTDEATHITTAGRDSPRVQIPDLFPGEKYEVNVTSVSHDLSSEEVFGSKILVPLQPMGVEQNKEETTTTSVTIGWTYDARSYYAERWAISYTDGDGVVELNETASEKSEYSLTLVNLKPGQTYSVRLKSVVLTAQSPVSELNVTAKPVITSQLEEMSTTNASFRMSYTVDAGDIFESFVFSIVNQENSRVAKAKADLDHEVGFDNLQAGTRYTVRAITFSNGEESAPISLDFITDPNPVPVTTGATARQITLTLGSQPGNVASHVVSCAPKDPAGAPCPEGTKTVAAGALPVVFSGLTPFTAYTFEVVTTTEKVNDKAKTASMTYDVQTAEAAPSAVQGLTASDLELHSLSLSWRPPAVANGQLRNYIVSYHGREPTYPEAPVHQNIVTVSASQTSLTLTDLKAGYEYLIKVFAKTVADGPSSQSNVTLPTGSPAFKSGVTAESSKPNRPSSNAVVTQTKLSLMFVNPFSFDRGYIRHFTVVVSKDPNADDSASTLPSWGDARKDGSIKVYQAIERCEDFFADDSPCGVGGGGSSSSSGSSRRRRAVNSRPDRVFTLGDQTKAECEGVAFCNGPLESDTQYYVKLRGFTSSGQFAETAYSEPIRTAEGSTSNGGIIGGVIGALVGIGVVVVIVGIVVRKRRQPKRATKYTGTNGNLDQASLNKLSRVVKLTNFEDYVRKMAADSDFKYAEEYEDLKEVGRGQPTLAAEFPPNRPKNRFTNILPYDHSRVKLLPTDDEEGSDYINANYMPGFSSKREYIATQGPLPGTRDDLWRMLWEQGSRNIVMLTKCQESGREKSDHYWPTDMEPKYYGDLQVVILAETPMPDWTITDLKVSLGDQSRVIRHFHYRSWPDFGVPPDPSSLLRFVRTVRERLINEGGPIMTHCSAGVGRSGTFIILDHLLQLIREKDEVDIFSMVYKLRKERVLMVQTEQQYKFIHECLLCVLQNREDDTTYANVGQINIGYEDEEDETRLVNENPEGD